MNCICSLPNGNNLLISTNDLAGIMKSVSWSTGVLNLVVYTASLNPSAAAKVTESFDISTFTPVSTGLDSSVAAAKTTWFIAFFNSAVEIFITIPSSIVGMGGYSL